MVPVDPARKLAIAEGAKGKDSRFANHQENPITTMVTKGADNSIDVVASWNSTAIQSLCLGVVLDAIQKGWLSQLDLYESPHYPYYAYVRLYRSVVNAMNGGSVDLNRAPMWYWYLTQALAPKIVGYKTGSINFKWNTSDVDVNFIPSFDFSVNGVVSRLGAADFNLEVDGFFQVTPAAAYDSTQGDNALQSLFGVYEQQNVTIMSSYIATPMLQNVSAFAANSWELGPASTLGGMVTTVYSEKDINVPLFAKFATYQPENGFRGWDRIARSGGSPCYVIPRMIDCRKLNYIYNRSPPQFRFYNFDEFFETLSLTVATALEVAQTSNTGAPTTCPLTSQQVRLLLRHTLMRHFGNQYGQDLTVDGTNTISMIPLTCAPNGVANTATNMLLPLFLCENIRACSRKFVQLGKSKKNGIDYIPILARPALPELGNFVFYDTDKNPIPVYNSNPSETPISTFDLSFVQASVKNYITTEGDYIVTLCTTWNEWIKSLANYLTPLADPGREKGLNALSTVLLTSQQVWQAPVPVPPNNANLINKTKLDKQQSKKALGMPRIKRYGVSATPEAGTSYFDQVQVSSITSTDKFLDPLVKYQKVMILPCALAEGEFKNYSTPSARQVFQIQPYRLAVTSLPTAAGVTGNSTLLSRHLAMAALDVKSPLAAPSEVEQDLMTASEMGRGGFFTSLAGLFAEDVLGIQGGKAIASAVGSALGI